MNNRRYVNYRNMRDTFYVDPCVFTRLSDVEKVVDTLRNMLKECGQATVDKYFELTNGNVCAGDSDYGWTDLSVIDIRSTRYGYELVLPTAHPVNVNHVQKAYDLLQNATEDDFTAVFDDAMNHLEKAL